MKRPEKDYFHQEHHSRNIGLLSESDQEKIGQMTLLIAGCGVGSQVALSAARIGFEKFILVDGDQVELSNINRQAYSWRDVGKNKVDALVKKIKAINPHAKVKKHPVFVDIENAEKLVKACDIIVDTIDPDAAQADIAMHRAARKQHKYLIYPVDVGWGALVYIFSPTGVSYEELLGLNPQTPLSEIDNEKAFSAFAQHFIKLMPGYVQEMALSVVEGKSAHYSQPVTAAYTLSAMTVAAAKRIALGLPFKIAPDYASFDPNTIFEPDSK